MKKSITAFRFISNADVEHHCVFLEFKQKLKPVAEPKTPAPIALTADRAPSPPLPVPVHVHASSASGAVAAAAATAVAPLAAPMPPPATASTPATPVASAKRNASQKSTGKRKRGADVREAIAKRPADDYFLQRSGKVSTSLQTLADAGLPTGHEVESRWMQVSHTHAAAVEAVQQRYAERDFNKWFFYLQCGFSVLLHGVGSKRQLLSQFGQAVGRAMKLPVVELDGHDPALTPRDMADRLSAASEHERYVLVLHSADGAALRSARARAVLQRALSASHDGASRPVLMASIDHVHAPLCTRDVVVSPLASSFSSPSHLQPVLFHRNTTGRPSCSLLVALHAHRSEPAAAVWDSAEAGARRWLYVAASTFAPYQHEGRPRALGTGADAAGSAGRALAVLRAVTRHAQEVFALIAAAGTEGLTLTALLRRCLDNMVAHDRRQLGTLLVELETHELVVTRQGRLRATIGPEVAEQVARELGISFAGPS